MKKTILLTVCTLSLTSAWATRTTREEATLAATHWLKTNFMARRYFADAAVTDVRAYDAATNFYIIGLAPQGHVLVAGSDLVKPILSFGRENFALPDADNPHAAILETYVELATSAEAVGGARHAKWTRILGGAKAGGPPRGSTPSSGAWDGRRTGN